jgi:hypothetical protein
MPNGQIIPREAEYTGKMLLFWDEVFDSVNGTSLKPHPYWKTKRVCASKESLHRKESFHRQFWFDSIVKIRQMQFVDQHKNPVPKVPSLLNWEKTLAGCIKILDILHDVGFEYVAFRNFNQDSLENFFGSIRSHNFRNVNPTPCQFSGSFKSLLINNLMSRYSIRNNCEKDDADGLFENLLGFLKQTDDTPQNLDESISGVVSEDYLEDNLTSTNGKMYTAGYVIRKISNSCTHCKRDMNTEPTSKHANVAMREFGKDRKLKYASDNMLDCFNSTGKLIRNYLSENASTHNIQAKLRTKILQKIDFTVFSCPLHKEEIKDRFIKCMLSLQIHAFCNTANKILNGKLNYSGRNKVYLAAGQKYNSRRRRPVR